MAFIMSALWKALGWAMPGVSASTFYLVAGSVAFSLVGSVAFFQGREGKAAAIIAERSACEIGKANDARTSAESLAHLLDKISKFEEDEGGKTPAQICAADPFCKKGRKK
jgi:hypothetical protein